MKVVICGGGIIGSSTAYHLAKKGVSSTVVDRCGIACAASGKAGGFLARDWSGSGAFGVLSRTSFDMHMELSKTFTDCDYRRVTTLSVDVNPDGRHNSEGLTLPSWIDRGVESVSTLGSTNTTAQVHPYKLSNAFIREAERLAGTQVHIGVIEEVMTSEGKVTGVKVNGVVIPADVVVITMGPWSGQARKWFKTLPLVTGDPAHSVVLKPKEGTGEIGADCLFTEFHGRGGGLTSPEIYPRPDGTVYVCWSKDKVSLPDDPSTIQSTDNMRKLLTKAATSVSSQLTDSELVLSNCCFLPCASGGGPIIGRIPGVVGAFVGTGHTCWGILNAPVTGACLAELIVDGKCSLVDISSFDPAKYG